MWLPPWSTPTIRPTMSPTSTSPTAPACPLAAGSTLRRRSRRSRCAARRESGSGDGSCDEVRLRSRSLAVGQHVAGDDDLLDLAGAVVNLGHFRVAKVT